MIGKERDGEGLWSEEQVPVDAEVQCGCVWTAAVVLLLNSQLQTS